MKCIKCGTELVENSIYCHICGKKQVQEPRKALKRPNGTGTVYKQKGRRKRPWIARKSGILIGSYETRTAALEALNRLTGRDISEKYNMTFKEVYEAWKEEYFSKVGQSAKEAYSTSYDVFEALHNKIFRNLRTADFQRVIDNHMHKSHSTVSKYKQLLTQMSKWGIREGIIITNYATFVTLPKAEKKEKEIFSDEDIKKLQKNDSETAKIILMLIYTGMRIGELFSLPLKDYHVTYVIGGEKTEAGKARTIPIRPEGRDYFAYFAEQATGEMLLSGYVGNNDTHNFRERDYYPLLEKLNIKKKSPHATRHTYTSIAVKKGMKPEILQRILGHAKYSTTADIYTHIDKETIISAAEQI